MTIQSLGQLTLGQAVPSLQTAALTLNASASAALGDVSARASAAATIQPPQLATDLLTNLSALLAAVSALASSGVSIIPPSINVELAAELQTTQASLQVAVDLAAQLTSLLGASGIHAWVYDGPSTGIGSALDGEIGAGLPGGDGTCTAVILAATLSPSTAALRTVFGV